MFFFDEDGNNKKTHFFSPTDGRVRTAALAEALQILQEQAALAYLCAPSESDSVVDLFVGQCLSGDGG